jgi:hypothetical protein
MRLILGLLFFLTITSAHAEPQIIQGFVCHEQSSAEAIGEAYAKGGEDVALQTANALMSERKCGLMTEPAIGEVKHIKDYVHLGIVARLIEIDFGDVKMYAMQRTGEIVT